MKTNILDDLNLPPDVREALSREAVRRQLPVGEVVKQILLGNARAIKASSGAAQPREQAA